MLTKANWDQFQYMCSSGLRQSAIADADHPMSLFTLKDIVEETIPKTSEVPKRFNKPWLTDSCVLKMNSQTSVKSVWNRIRKIKENHTSNTVHHLSLNYIVTLQMYWQIAFQLILLLLLSVLMLSS